MDRKVYLWFFDISRGYNSKKEKKHHIHEIKKYRALSWDTISYIITSVNLVTALNVIKKFRFDEIEIVKKKKYVVVKKNVFIKVPIPGSDLNWFCDNNSPDNNIKMFTTSTSFWKCSYWFISLKTPEKERYSLPSTYIQQPTISAILACLNISKLPWSDVVPSVTLKSVKGYSFCQTFMGFWITFYSSTYSLQCPKDQSHSAWLETTNNFEVNRQR